MASLDRNDWPSSKNSFQSGMEVPVTWPSPVLKGWRMGVFCTLSAVGNALLCIWKGSALLQFHLLSAAGQRNSNFLTSCIKFMKLQSKGQAATLSWSGHHPLSNMSR